MTWQELVNDAHHTSLLPRVWKKRTLPRKLVEQLLRHAFDSIAAQALHGERVAIPGFGVFTLRTRKARRIQNPQTHQPMQLPPSKTIGFRCSKTIRR